MIPQTHLLFIAPHPALVRAFITYLLGISNSTQLSPCLITSIAASAGLLAFTLAPIRGSLCRFPIRITWGTCYKAQHLGFLSPSLMPLVGSCWVILTWSQGEGPSRSRPGAASTQLALAFVSSRGSLLLSRLLPPCSPRSLHSGRLLVGT